MNEQPIRFGPDGALAGIFHTAAGAPSASTPTVIILPAGLDQKVGPTRLYLGIARAVAAAGFPVLRFDYFGLGESFTRPVSMSRDVRLPSDPGADVDLAIEWARAAQGHPGVVLLGLCSGAHDAHRVAVRDEQVVGVCQLDGYGYRTRRYWLHYTIERIFDERRWFNLIRRSLMRFGEIDESDPIWGGVDFFTMPAKEELAAELRRMMARDQRLLYVFSGQTSNYYNYEQQFAASFPDVDFGGRLTERFIAAADHTFSRSIERRQLTAHIADWLVREFTPPV